MKVQEEPATLTSGIRLGAIFMCLSASEASLFLFIHIIKAESLNPNYKDFRKKKAGAKNKLILIFTQVLYMETLKTLN